MSFALFQSFKVEGGVQSVRGGILDAIDVRCDRDGVHGQP